MSRLKMILRSMNKILLKTVFIAFSTIATIVFKFYLGYLILKTIDATPLMWWLFWLSVPCLLGIDWLNKYLEKISKDSDRLLGVSKDIGEKYKP